MNKITMLLVCIFVMVLAIPVANSQLHSISDRESLVKMVENKNYFTNPYTIYEVCNPTLEDFLPSKTDEFNVSFVVDKGTGLTDSGYQMWTEEIYYVKEPIYNTYKDVNGTDVSEVIGFNSIEHSRWDWKDFDPYKTRWNPSQCYKIRVWGKREAKLGDYNVDNIISFASKEFKEYAWWNVSAANCSNITFTNPNTFDIVYDYAPPVRVNLTNLKIQNITQEVHIVDTSCSMGGSEVEVRILGNGSNWAYVEIMSPNITAGASVNFSVYHDWVVSPDRYNDGSGVTLSGGEKLDVTTAFFDLNLINLTRIGLNPGYNSLQSNATYLLQSDIDQSSSNNVMDAADFLKLFGDTGDNVYVYTNINGTFVVEDPFFTEINWTIKSGGNVTYTFYQQSKFIKIEIYENNASDWSYWFTEMNQTGNHSYYQPSRTRDWKEIGTEGINSTYGMVGFRQFSTREDYPTMMWLWNPIEQNVTEHPQSTGSNASFYLSNNFRVKAGSFGSATGESVPGGQGWLNNTFWFGYTTNTSTLTVNESYSVFITTPITYTYDALPMGLVGIFNYSLQNESYGSTVLEGTASEFALTILVNETRVYNVNATLFWNGTEYVFDSYAENGRYRTWTKTINIPLIDSDSEVVEFYWNYTVNYTVGFGYGSHDYDNTTYRNQTITGALITNCSVYTDSYNTTMWLFMRDEERPNTAVNSSLEATFDVGGTKYTFNYTQNYTQYRFCLFPGNQSTEATIEIEYDAQDYSQRNYYFANITLSNTSINRSLYLLYSNLSTQITFEVKDTYGELQDEVIVKAQRYFLGEDNYVMVAMTRMGYDGQGITQLRQNRWYRFTLERSGVTLATLAPTQLTSNSLTLYLPAEETIPIFDYFNGVSSTCSYSNVTKNIVCTVNDESGHMQSVYLTANLISAAGETLLCSDSSTSPTTTLTCNIGGYSSGSIVYRLYGNFASFESVHTMLTGSIDFLDDEYGNMGLLMVTFLIITAAAIGAWYPPIGLVLIAAVVIFSSLLGFMTIGIEALVGLIAVLAIIIYRMR